MYDSLQQTHVGMTLTLTLTLTLDGLINGGRGGGLISEGAYNRNKKKTVSKRDVAVLIEIRLSFTGF